MSWHISDAHMAAMHVPETSPLDSLGEPPSDDYDRNYRDAIGERDYVAAAIRRTLPEFAQRNGITLSSHIMDNLAMWVTGVVPSGYVRAGCPVGGPCACMGVCQRWSRITE